MGYWHVSPEWSGQTVYILAGGPSAAGQPIEALAARRVIAINSSWERAPFADILFFGDSRWWHEFNDEVLAHFIGRIVTSSPDAISSRLLRLKIATHKDRLSLERCEVMIRYTSLTAALNVAQHLGAAKIVLIGADGQPGADGRVHHHKEYPPRLAGHIVWQEQRVDLCHAARSLREAGIEVVNASPGSALADIWPIVSLQDCL